MTEQGWAPISPAMVVARALAQRGSGIYKLGGGAHFRASTVYDALENRYPGTSDCTSLVSYSCMYYKNGWNTDAIVKDAKGSNRRFHLVKPDVPVRPSDLLITGNLEDGPDHAGIIVEVLDGFVRGSRTEGREWWRYLRVAHCSGYKQLTIDPKTGKVFGATRVEDAHRWRKVDADGHYSRIIRANHVTNEPITEKPVKEGNKPADDSAVIDTSMGAIAVAGIGAVMLVT